MTEVVQAVLVALVVALGGIGGQWLLRRQDFRRQDEVAARVAEVAKQQQADNTKVATRLDEIHTLVNSNMTAAIRGELIATEAQLLLAQRIAQLEPSPEDNAVLTNLQERIAELRSIVADRAQQLIHADAIVDNAG